MHTLIVLICFSAQGVQEPATLRGGMWLPRLGGTITDGVGAVDLETNIDLRAGEGVPILEFQVEPVENIVMSFSFLDFFT